jgi:hypothetical protein
MLYYCGLRKKISGDYNMPQAYAKVWLANSDGEHDERCPTDFNKHCGGWVWHSNRVARTWRGKQTRARCTRICSGNIQYAPGKGGNPCDGANKIRHINPSEGMGNALECTWNTINEGKLKSMSGNIKLTNSSMTNKTGSVYEQLLFGTKIGGYNTEGKGFCENANNLEKVVDKNGDTCYKKIVKKLGEAVGKQKGIEYCKNNKTDPKCKCINVSGSNFVQECRKNPSWAGCSDIIKAADSYASVGVLQSITGLSGGADCLVPGICSGDVYAPQTIPQSCANQIGICDQVLNIDVGKIDEAAKLDAFQGCDIQFQTVKDKGKSTSGTSSGIPSIIGGGGDGEGALTSFIPTSVSDLKKDTNKQLFLGGGGLLLSMSCCILVLLIVALSSGGKGGGPTRFRRR